MNSNVVIVDLDGTLIPNSSEVYEQLGFDITGSQKEIIKKGLESLKGKTISEISKLKTYFKYDRELIELLNNKKKEGAILLLVTNNPGGELFAPDNLTFDEIYSAITPEIKGEIITGNILKEYTKTEIVEDILQKYKINSIEVYADGGEGDKEMIKYIKKSCGDKLKVYGYDSMMS